jgi:DNA-binding NarL/FixJ family response regulator
MIKVGIVDDHAIVRQGLRQYLSEHVDLRVVGRLRMAVKPLIW